MGRTRFVITRRLLEACAVAAALMSGACKLPVFADEKETVAKAVSDTTAAARHVVAGLGLATDAADSRPDALPPTPAPRPVRKTGRGAQPAVIPVEIIAPEPDVIPAVESAGRDVGGLAAAPGEAAAAAAAAPIVRRETFEIYSDEDPDVTPARLLTTQTGGALFRGVQADMNTMELIVSSQGRVEQVRLISPPRRMTDMLLLSGAKTWKFAPALKDGVPVRYRTTISWETTP